MRPDVIIISSLVVGLCLYQVLCGGVVDSIPKVVEVYGKGSGDGCNESSEDESGEEVHISESFYVG